MIVITKYVSRFCVVQQIKFHLGTQTCTRVCYPKFGQFKQHLEMESGCLPLRCIKLVCCKQQTKIISREMVERNQIQYLFPGPDFLNSWLAPVCLCEFLVIILYKNIDMTLQLNFCGILNFYFYLLFFSWLHWVRRCHHLVMINTTGRTNSSSA